MIRALVVPAMATALSLLGVPSGAPPAQAGTTDGLSAAVGSTVIVSTPGGNGAGVYLGEGRVLTAAHVVPGQTAALRGERALGLGRVTRRDESRDLLLLELDSDPRLASVDLRSEPARVGEQVFAAGAPMSEYVQLSAGIVSAIVEQQSVGMVQTDAAINPGNSGGPLLDEDGAIVGIVVSKSSDDEGIGWATSSEEVAQFLSQPKAGSEQSAETGHETAAPSVAIPQALSVPAVASILALGAAAAASAGLLRRRRSTRRPPFLDLSDLAG